MQHALMLADRAEALGEIPVGAVLVDDEGNILGEGWNLSIIENDPTAHAEMLHYVMCTEYSKLSPAQYHTLCHP